MSYFTREEQQNRNVDKMGKQLGNTYTALWQETAQLFMAFGEFVELFGISKERVDLLNKVAPNFFHHIQGLMWDNILLSIARITDKPSLAKNTNITVCSLPNLVEDGRLKIELTSNIDKLINLVEFCRSYRNKKIAHLDFGAYWLTPALALERGTRKRIEEILNEVEAILNLVDGHFFESETRFKHISVHGGASTLVNKLKKAKDRN
jgi:hypothetical protein